MVVTDVEVFEVVETNWGTYRKDSIGTWESECIDGCGVTWDPVSQKDVLKLEAALEKYKGWQGYLNQ